MISVFGHWFSKRSMHLFFSEQAGIMAGLLSAGAAIAVRGPVDPVLLILRAALTTAVFQAAIYGVDLYDARTARLDAIMGNRALTALGLALLALAPLALVAPRFTLPAGSLAIGAAAAAAVVLGLRNAFGGEGPEKVVVLGTGARARWIGRALQQELAGDYTLAGFLDDGLLRQGPVPLPLAMDGPARAHQACSRLGASVLVLACDDRRGTMPADVLLECRVSGIEVIEAWVFAERALRRIAVEQVRAGELALAGGWSRTQGRTWAKRLLDIAIAALFLILSAPVLLLSMLAVRLSSPGPIFYAQERVGRGGRVYAVWKLRTMRANAEASSGPTWAGARDPRVTRVGRFMRKTRLDELPQLFNVLAGDMSMVGPRPERPFFVSKLKESVPYYELRETVRPGVTGWAQIRCPYGASVEDARVKLEHDLYYLKNGTLWLDLVVLFHTAKTVLFAKGAR